MMSFITVNQNRNKLFVPAERRVIQDIEVSQVLNCTLQAILFRSIFSLPGVAKKDRKYSRVNNSNQLLSFEFKALRIPNHFKTLTSGFFSYTFESTFENLAQATKQPLCSIGESQTLSVIFCNCNGGSRRTPMKKTAIILILLLAACSTPAPRHYSTSEEGVASPEWKQGELLKLTGTIWPSAEQAKFFIDTVDGKSAHLKGPALSGIKPGSKVTLKGRVECVTGYGTAGASDILHSQTLYYVNVTDCKVLDEAPWDIEYQNAIDVEKPKYSSRDGEKF